MNEGLSQRHIDLELSQLILNQGKDLSIKVWEPSTYNHLDMGLPQVI